jgi:phosphate-selective porin OprO/OprP
VPILEHACPGSCRLAIYVTLAIALVAEVAWSQAPDGEIPAGAPQPPAGLAAKLRRKSARDSASRSVLVVAATETEPERVRADAVRYSRPSAGTKLPFSVADDARDGKMLELESRLAETERRLEMLAANPLAVAGPADDSDDPLASLGLAPDEPFQTDTERMSDLEERYRALESRLNKANAPTSKEEKKETFPTHKITGFLQLDTAFYSQDANNAALVGNAQNGTGFRRARLAVLGKVAPKTLYQMEVDFATAGRPSFFDNYVEQEQIPILGALRAGQYLQPFSVDAMSGFRNLPFLERSLPFLAFVPFRRVGIMASNNSEDERTYWAYSGFRTGGFNNAPLGDSQFGTDFGNVGGYSFSTRLTHLLIYEGDEEFWHAGAAYNFGQLGANNAVGSGTAGNAGSPEPFYQARAAPEFGLLGQPQNGQIFGSAVNGTPNFVDSGRYQAHSFNLFGVETLFQEGPLSVQAEWMLTNVNSVVGPINYNGAYFEFMYRLTGESRPYDKKLGALRNVVPFHDFFSFEPEKFGEIGLGAWELAGRVSYVDIRNPSNLSGHYYDSATNLFNGSAATGAIGNGTLTDITVGGTWFLNKHTKWQFDWIHAFLNNKANGFSQADLYVTRIQVDF